MIRGVKYFNFCNDWDHNAVSFHRHLIVNAFSLLFYIYNDGSVGNEH